MLNWIDASILFFINFFETDMGKNRNRGATSFNHFAKQIEVTATTIIKIQPQTLTQVLLCCCDFITSSWPRSELSIKEIFIFKTTSCLCKLIGFWEGFIRVVNISIDSLLVVLVGHLTRTWHSHNAELPANVFRVSRARYFIFPFSLSLSLVEVYKCHLSFWEKQFRSYWWNACNCQ